MFTQLCKQHFTITLFQQPIFTSKTYNHAVTYNHASADDNLQNICIFGNVVILQIICYQTLSITSLPQHKKIHQLMTFMGINL